MTCHGRHAPLLPMSALSMRMLIRGPASLLEALSADRNSVGLVVNGNMHIQGDA
jgi:hypothetical protein